MRRGKNNCEKTDISNSINDPSDWKTQRNGNPIEIVIEWGRIKKKYTERSQIILCSLSAHCKQIKGKNKL